MTDPFPVPTTWHDLVSARRMWRDAPADDEQLQTLLDIAQQQVVVYGPQYFDVDGNPATLPPDAVPENFRQAQLMQARNIWNATKVDAGTGQIGDDTFQIRPFPLDWMVKQIIRPKAGVPFVG